jgi:uncharacterized protein (DUF2147 family)
MTRLLALAAFLLASSAAHAQYTFHYGGHTIHIDPDRGTVSIPGVYDNSGRKSRRTRSIGHEQAGKHHEAPQAAKVQAQQPPVPAVSPTDTANLPAPQAATSATTDTPPQAAAPAATVNNAQPDATAQPQSPSPRALAPLEQHDTTSQAAPADAVAAVPSPASRPAPAPASAAPRDPNSPVGVWLTAQKEGKVRIEPCGANLCGYSVDAKSSQNSEQILINMKPGKGLKWSGRILDPNTGSTYDSTIALKGPDTLRVQGCAFGGMFCGGQTWTRVN